MDIYFVCMDIRKIALYLSWKLPPDYVKFNRLEFMEYLSEIFWFWFDRLDFYWKQAKEYEEEFYFLVLDYLFSKWQKDENEKIKFDKLLGRLNLIVNEEVKKEEIDFDLLIEKWNKLKTERNSQNKWAMLESFLEGFFNCITGIEVIEKNLKNDDEEIDLVLKNSATSWFFQNLNSPLILVEAKNWKGKAQTKVSRDFNMKVQLHNNLTRIWILVSVNWFTGEVDELLKRLGSTNIIPVLISWNEIEECLSNKPDMISWLETQIVKSLK